MKTERKRIRRRRWSAPEDELIREAAFRNAFYGLSNDHEYQARLQSLAEALGRTYAAVRMRASRIRAVSYTIKQQRRIDDGH